MSSELRRPPLHNARPLLPRGRLAVLDSLRHALVYQDTIVRQLAAGAGVSVRSPLFPAP